MNAKEALLNIGFSDEESDLLMPSLFLYLFRAFNQAELRRRAFKVNPNVDMFKLLPRLPLMGELTLDDKVCIFALYNGMDPGVTPNAYIKDVVLKNKELRRYFKENFDEHPAYTLAQVRALEAKAIINKEISTYLNKFVYRKMSFITNNYGVHKSELIEAMQERAIYNLRINYPNWNATGDMLAMAKSAISNAGHNLIHFYSAEKRAKVDRNNKAVEYSLESMQEMAGDSPEYQALIYSDAFEYMVEKAEAAMSVDKLIKGLDNSPKLQRFVKLLSGKFDAGFTDFLDEDNMHFADTHEFDRIFKEACKYLNYDVEATRVSLKKLST